MALCSHVHQEFTVHQTHAFKRPPHCTIDAWENMSPGTLIAYRCLWCSPANFDIRSVDALKLNIEYAARRTRAQMHCNVTINRFVSTIGYVFYYYYINYIYCALVAWLDSTRYIVPMFSECFVYAFDDIPQRNLLVDDGVRCVCVYTHYTERRLPVNQWENKIKERRIKRRRRKKYARITGRIVFNRRSNRCEWSETETKRTERRKKNHFIGNQVLCCCFSGIAFHSLSFQCSSFFILFSFSCRQLTLCVSGIRFCRFCRGSATKQRSSYRILCARRALCTRRASKSIHYLFQYNLMWWCCFSCRRRSKSVRLFALLASSSISLRFPLLSENVNVHTITRESLVRFNTFAEADFFSSLSSLSCRLLFFNLFTSHSSPFEIDPIVAFIIWWRFFFLYCCCPFFHRALSCCEHECRIIITIMTATRHQFSLFFYFDFKAYLIDLT